MKNIGWPRIPFLIGLVLAPGIERYLQLSISLHGNGWYTRPGVVLIFLLILLVVFGRWLAPSVKHLRKRLETTRS